MYKFYNLILRLGVCSGFLLILVIPNMSIAKTIALEMVPPVDGVAHISPAPALTPEMIMDAPFSTDQNLANLLNNNPNTFYQPTAGSNAPSIGSDVLLRFEFPDIPDNAIINSVVLSVGISSENTDEQFRMGFGFASYNRDDPTRYLDVDISPPGTKGAFLISEMTPPFNIPPLIGIQTPIPSVFSMHLADNELNVDNVRNLGVVLLGVNEAPELFDRISLVNATINYTIPEVPTLSTWMLILLGVVLLSVALVYRRRLARYQVS